MKWKLFFGACVNLVWVCFPQNIIGCGPGIDPYDYYTSFMSASLPEAKAYQPFYYTGYSFLYDTQEPVDAAGILANEWAAYCGVPVTDKDALAFVTQYDREDLKKIYSHIEKKQALVIPAAVKVNSMTNYFIKNKDLEGLGYLMYAKQVEPFVTGDYNNWEAINRDSLKMDKLMKNGRQLFNAAKTDFFKMKYGYQVMRLAHYSGNYTASIQAYDDLVKGNKTQTILQPMSLALKAGALFYTGNTMESAYLFSRAFSASQAKRVSNYLGFDWAVDSKKNRAEYLGMCANNKEKADMLAMFALGTSTWETSTMQQIYQLNPSADVLQVLAIREINKLEELYLTPQLNKENGGKTFFYSWSEGNSDSALQANKLEAKKLQDFLHKVATEGKAPNPGIFETGAAYAALMQRDYTAARVLLDKAKAMKLSPKLTDQWQLTNVLLTINAADKIDEKFEEQLLPSLKWLSRKALADQQEGDGWSQPPSQWKIFYRNLMSEVLAKRYRQQSDRYKEALAVGSAEYIMNGGKASQYESISADFLHNQSSSKDVETLFNYLNAKAKKPYAEFLATNNALKMPAVIDFAGTAYLRDNNYSKAIEWFAKSSAASAKIIEKDPFKELLYDQEERITGDKVTTTKLAFAKQMLQLQILIKTDKAKAADNLYKMALGFYNTTYYGYAWQLVEYYRSGSDGYYIPKDATDFQKNYYGCYKAHDYFKMAMDASGNKEFKAKCLFMMAKCSQKQLRRPQYEDFGYNWENYDAGNKTYNTAFMNNRYFPQLIQQYGATAFYQEAFNSCSYLRDFSIVK